METSDTIIVKRGKDSTILDPSHVITPSFRWVSVVLEVKVIDRLTTRTKHETDVWYWKGMISTPTNDSNSRR